MPLSQYSGSFHTLVEAAYLRSAKRGEMIATTDDARSIFCVKKGFVKRYHIKNDGSISIQGIYGPGDCFGMTVLARLLMEGFAYTGSEVYYYEAISDVEIYEIPHALLKPQLALHAELYKDLFTILGWHSLANVWRLENQGLENATKRVAHIICYYMERYGIPAEDGWTLKIPLTQQDVADVLDLSRETVSIAISELRRVTLLKSGRKFVVPSLDELKSYAYT